MTQPLCRPEMNISPLPCAPSEGGGSPGELAGCCSPSIATTTLCLEDCTPISLVIRSGCTECQATPDDPALVGWLDAAGVFTPGPAPAGAGPCDRCGDPSPGEPCAPPGMCQGLVGLSGPEEWTPPPGTQSINLSVVCAPVIVFPCTGATEGVTINECGALSFSAPGGPCEPGSFCGEFRIEVPVGSDAYVSYLVAGCEETL